MNSLLPEQCTLRRLDNLGMELINMPRKYLERITLKNDYKPVWNAKDCDVSGTAAYTLKLLTFDAKTGFTRMWVRISAHRW